MKKNYKQMTREEVRVLVSRIKRINDCKISLSEHAIQRMKERNIKEYEVREVFKNFNIVEFESRPEGDISAIIKNKNRGLQLFLSVNLTTGNILTVYRTRKKNVHGSVTNPNLNIISFLNYYRIKKDIRKLKGRN